VHAGTLQSRPAGAYSTGNPLSGIFKAKSYNKASLSL
jgi:hypothetical protein